MDDTVKTTKLAALVILFTVTGCAVTPETKQSLISYTTAMEQVQVATEEFLLDFSAADELRKELEKATQAGDKPDEPLFPASYKPGQTTPASVTGVQRDIQARRDALAAIAAYNAALVGLAEGRSESEIALQLSTFGDSVGSVTGALGMTVSAGFTAIGPLVAKIGALVQDGLNAAEFDDALAAGQPLVEAILEQMKKDTTQYYAASVVVTNRKRDAVNVEIRKAAFAIRRVASNHAAPETPKLTDEVSTLTAELTEIGRATRYTEAMPVPLPFDAGKPVFNETAAESVRGAMEDMRTAAAADAEIVAAQNAYYLLMDAYVATLDQTKKSLAAVRSSLDAPVNIESEARRLLTVALGLRNALGSYRAAR